MRIILIIIMILMVYNVHYAQKAGQAVSSPNSPPKLNLAWWTVDNGGGKSTNSGLIFQSSIGQVSTQKMSNSSISIQNGYTPGSGQISGISSTIGVGIKEGWNLLSLPLKVGDYRKTKLYPRSVSDAFIFANSYSPVETLKNGEGYWLKFPNEEKVPLSGASYTSDTSEVQGGWNMIGSLFCDVLVTEIMPVPPLEVLSKYFGYNENYFEEDTLHAGLGYWVKVNGSGKLVIKSSMLKTTVNSLSSNFSDKNEYKSEAKKFAEANDYNELKIKDASGKSMTLFYKANVTEEDMSIYEIPPQPPGGIFDVRFGSQRTIEVIDQSTKRGELQRFPILINGGVNPFSITWNISPSEDLYKLEVILSDHEPKVYSLVGSGKVVLNTKDVKKISLLMGENISELPKEYTLRQNYPNPFNPVTTIMYDLPFDSKVEIRIFNVLGQEIGRLIDEIQVAGYKKVKYDAGELPSGVYFYQIEATGIGNSMVFSDVKKMLLVR